MVILVNGKLAFTNMNQMLYGSNFISKSCLIKHDSIFIIKDYNNQLNCLDNYNYLD